MGGRKFSAHQVFELAATPKRLEQIDKVPQAVSPLVHLVGFLRKTDEVRGLGRRFLRRCLTFGHGDDGIDYFRDILARNDGQSVCWHVPSPPKRLVAHHMDRARFLSTCICCPPPEANANAFITLAYLA